MKRTSFAMALLLVFTALAVYAQTARTHLDNGYRLLDQENYDGAMKELNEAIRLDPKLALAYTYRGYIFHVQRDYDRAIADYTEALRLDPNNNYVKENLALARQAQSQGSVQQAATAQQAQTGPNSPDDFDFIQNSRGGLTITDYRGKSPNVIIPSTISGLKVTDIDTANHYYFTSDSKLRDRGIRSVVIPNTVIEIAEGAFRGCKELSSVQLPDSLVTIGSVAFMECSALTSIVIPNSATTIGAAAFRGCNLSSLTLGNRVTRIGQGAFWDNKLTTVQLPASVIVLGEDSFRNNPLTSINIPPSLAKSAADKDGYNTSGFNDAFRGVSSLTRIIMPANVDDGNLIGGGNIFASESFVNFYKVQGRKAGTYVYSDRLWRLQ